MPQTATETEDSRIRAIRLEKGDNVLLELAITRNENIEITFRLSTEIEQFFQRTSIKSKNTTKWKDVNGNYPDFYEWKSSGSDAVADGFMESYLNTYGGPLFDGERANVSILRTVNSSHGITLSFGEMMSKETIEEFARQVRDFVLKLYKQFIRKVTVKTTITVEEVV